MLGINPLSVIRVLPTWHDCLFCKGNDSTKMRKLIFTLSLLLVCFSAAFAQSFYAYKNNYNDSRQRFFVFDNGKVRQLEQQGVQNYTFGKSFVVYTDVARNFKMSFATSSQRLEGITPSSYKVKANMFAYIINGNLKVYWAGRIKKIAQNTGSFSLSDSLIYFQDRNNYDKVFYNGGVYQIGLKAVTKPLLGRNILAYISNNNRFTTFYRGEKILVDDYIPLDFKVGANTIGFKDVNAQLKVFHKGNVFTVSKVEPDFYEVGDDVMIWGSPGQNFYAYNNGKLTTLLEFIPPKGTYGVVDSLVYFEDVNNQFKVFDQGEIHTVLTYKPNAFKIMNSMMLFTDQYNRLHMYKNGEVKEISKRVVTDFAINWDTIIYWTNQSNIMYIYSNGQEIPITLN